MAKISYKMNMQDVRKIEKQIATAIDESNEDTFDFFKKKTPVDGGNARRNTKFKESAGRAVINADYPYADRLDNGYSRQAPQGMSKPSLRFLERILKSKFKRI